MPAESPPDAQALQQCHDVLATAAALGMPVPGIPGMRLYSPTVFLDREIEIDLGLFSEEKGAQRAIALWAIREMHETSAMLGSIMLGDQGSVDWDEAVFQAWVEATPPEDVIDVYFNNQNSDSWSIEEVVVKPRFPQGRLSLEEAFPNQAS